MLWHPYWFYPALFAGCLFLSPKYARIVPKILAFYPLDIKEYLLELTFHVE